MKTNKEFVPETMTFSGWFFLRAIARKVGKVSLTDVTAQDIHKFGHLENTNFDQEHPEGDRIPALFKEQISLKLAQEMVDNPNKTWQSD